jgi:hypothetical protein
VPLPVGELRRGRIVYGVYPFASQFPSDLADGTTLSTVEDFVRRFKGSPAALQTEVRLRPLLLLHNGTRGDHHDVACLRINSVKDRHRRSESWERITRHEHPFFFHLPRDVRYGLPLESIVAVNSVGTIHKSAIPDLRVLGELNLHEMQIVSERLARALSLDLAPLIVQKAQQLLRQAGVEHP